MNIRNRQKLKSMKESILKELIDRRIPQSVDDLINLKSKWSQKKT